MGLDRPPSLQSMLGFHLESQQQPLRRLHTRGRRDGRGLPSLPPPGQPDRWPGQQDPRRPDRSRPHRTPALHHRHPATTRRPTPAACSDGTEVTAATPCCGTLDGAVAVRDAARASRSQQQGPTTRPSTVRILECPGRPDRGTTRLAVPHSRLRATRHPDSLRSSPARGANPSLDHRPAHPHGTSYEPDWIPRPNRDLTAIAERFAPGQAASQGPKPPASSHRKSPRSRATTPVSPSDPRKTTG